MRGTQGKKALKFYDQMHIVVQFINALISEMEMDRFLIDF